MFIDPKTPRLLILITFLVTSVCMSYAADNRPACFGYAESSPNSCASPVGNPAQKMPLGTGVSHGPVLMPGCGSERLVPMTCEEPGPIRAIAFYTVGVIKSTIAAPFRLLETLIPVGKGNDCGPVRPPGSGPLVCQPQPGFSTCKPAVVGCAPASPNLGPRPGSSSQPLCGVKLPPQVIKEYEFPPLESDNLLSGLWNLPATLMRQGRITGDVFRNDVNVSEIRKR